MRNLSMVCNTCEGDMAENDRRDREATEWTLLVRWSVVLKENMDLDDNCGRVDTAGICGDLAKSVAS